MTDEQIEAAYQAIRLAARDHCSIDHFGLIAIARWHIQQVEAEVRKEREACAKIADGYERRAAGVAFSTEYDDGVESAAEFIAEDIRQRGGEGA